MNVVVEKPIDSFFAAASKYTTSEDLYVLSPFITTSSARLVADFAKERNTTLRIVTNLDPLQINFSFSNPMKPLLDLLSDKELTLNLRKCNQLHAKVYYLNASCCVFGSSNLTLGGIAKNLELNALVDIRKDKKAMLDIEAFIQ
ncbi:MAG: phospholipase D-like domain-containing protein, partial [Spirochaeta sp.]|nr:phospholipase D-like domain-containing protein [Spirochaeta sp.]